MPSAPERPATAGAALAAAHPVTLEALEGLGRIPDDTRCVFVGGSLVRGLGNARSDVDVYVVTGEQPPAWDADFDRVALTPDTVPIAIEHVDGRRWDIEYWTTGQLEQLLELVQPAVLEQHQPAGPDVLRPGYVLLDRLLDADVLSGEAWLAPVRAQLEASAFGALLITQALEVCDHYYEDALGQLEDGDGLSAVLSAHRAFSAVVDALLVGYGRRSIGTSKWQARMMAAADPRELPFEEYWPRITMRDLDRDDPRDWVSAVLAECQRLQIEIDVLA